MSWEKVKLGDIAISIQTGPFGSQLHQSDYSDEGTPVIMPKDIMGDEISQDSIARVPPSFVQKLARHKVISQDIIYPRRGDIAKCAYINKGQEGWLCGTGCLKVTLDQNKVSPKFVFYQLRTDAKTGWLENHSVGATMPNLNTGILESIPLELPPFETQQQIASILSRYDDLISNYRQQIKLLEEAAQRIYKEWFVDMKFPNHENAVFGEDGLPKGWERLPLGTLGEFKRGKTITKSDVTGGTIPVVAGGLTPAYYHSKANTANRVITVSGSGANAGFTRIYYQKIWASDCSFLDSEMTGYLHFVYCTLKLNKAYMDNLQKGAAQPHVYAKDINAMKVCMPNEATLELFEQRVKPLFDIIGNLCVQDSYLSESRDRLLPRLMSGEIAV